MKGRNRIIPAILAAVLGILLILVIPVDFDRYLLIQREFLVAESSESYSFGDVYGEGRDDLITCEGFMNGMCRNFCGVYSFTEDFQRVTIDQVNVNELMHTEYQAWTTDFDHDGGEELYMASAEDNQIYLVVYEDPDLKKLLLNSVIRYRGQVTVQFCSRGLQDVSGDGCDEVFICMGNGFPIYPRRLYRVDLKSAKVKGGPLACTGFGVPSVRITKKDLSVISGLIQMPGSHRDSTRLPYPDTCGYAYAMNQNMEFLFDPVPVPYPGHFHQQFVDGHLWVVWSGHWNSDKVVLEKKSLEDGNVIADRELEFFKPNLLAREGELRLANNGALQRVGGDMKLEEVLARPDIHNSSFFKDVNGDGHMEFISSDFPHRKLTVFSADLDQPITLQTEGGVNKLLIREMGPNRSKMVLWSKTGLNFYEYRENPFFWMRWPYYILIFGFAGLGSWILFGRFQKNVEARDEQRLKLHQLQLLSIKNQVDTHFTLNALNSIDWMYRNNETAKASSFMGKLSRLMHQTVMNSDKIGTTLYEELDFCRNYCELEKLREEQFSYEIEVDAGIDAFEVEIPKQLIFTHVENAIKHGLRPKEGGKRLWINAAKQNADLRIEVTDDGGGFEEKPATEGTGMGLRIAAQIIGLYEQIFFQKINISYSRVNGKTTVDINIPRAVNYKDGRAAKSKKKSAPKRAQDH